MERPSRQSEIEIKYKEKSDKSADWQRYFNLSFSYGQAGGSLFLVQIANRPRKPPQTTRIEIYRWCYLWPNEERIICPWTYRIKNDQRRYWSIQENNW